MREEAAQATALAAEAAKLADAQALTNAREQEHRMAVKAAIALKTKHDKARWRNNNTSDTVYTHLKPHFLCLITSNNQV